MARPRPHVTIGHGTLRGIEKNGVAVFKGVPYAAPPVGDLRWRPPQPVAGWEGVRDAKKHGPTAMQMGTDIHAFLDGLVDGQGWSRLRAGLVKLAARLAPTPKESEDCLYLSVRTPSLEPGAGLPVMVWIHGGDHLDGAGSDPYYDAEVLASEGVVTVSINYRLGLMGYFAHPELMDESEHGVAGNYGTLDQIAALTWVRDNIAAFGGDPDNVTIFGESAGGESVIHMLTSPLAAGLFHRAIPQSAANSGQLGHLTRPFLGLRAATDTSVAFAAACGVSGDGAVARLRAMSADALYDVARADAEVGAHYPTIDGHVLPESPFEVFAAGRQAPVPLLIGSNADEGSIIWPLFGQPLNGYRFHDGTAEELPSYMVDEFGDDLEELLEIYPGLDTRSPDAETSCLGDSMFGAPAFHYATHHAAAGHPTFLYFFERVPESPRQTAGAYHAAEVSFVHGSRVPILPMSDADEQLSTRMRGHWRAFADSGDPDDGTGEWGRFDATDPRWMRFDHTSRFEPVHRARQYSVFTRRIDRLIEQMRAAR